MPCLCYCTVEAAAFWIMAFLQVNFVFTWTVHVLHVTTYILKQQKHCSSNLNPVLLNSSAALGPAGHLDPPSPSLQTGFAKSCDPIAKHYLNFERIEADLWLCIVTMQSSVSLCEHDKHVLNRVGLFPIPSFLLLFLFFFLFFSLTSFGKGIKKSDKNPSFLKTCFHVDTSENW